MRKVLALVSFRVYPTLMGGQKGVAMFYEHLARHLPVVLALSKDNETHQAEGISAINLLHSNRRIYRNLGVLRALSKLVRQEQVGLIVAEHSYTAWLALWLARRHGLPLLIHSHNIEAQRFRQMGARWWGLYHRYERWVHRKADHSFFISEEDRDRAVKTYRVKPDKTSVVTYGVQVPPPPFRTQKAPLKAALGLDPGKILLLFNGTLDYHPNTEAVRRIIEDLIPRLRPLLPPFQVAVTGNRAPDALLAEMRACPELLYTGWVPDVNAYYSAADLFLNSVRNDSGVKTKVIEAVAAHCTTVSTREGAMGLRADLCGDKLVTVDGGDWDIFARSVQAILQQPVKPTTAAFYDYYSWPALAERAAEQMQQLMDEHPRS